MTARDDRGWFVREPIRHGSYAGAVQHYRRGGKPCEVCLPAFRAYKRAYRPPAQPPPPLALSRARELRDLGKLSGTAQQAAWAAGRSERTIQRYRRLLREAA